MKRKSLIVIVCIVLMVFGFTSAVAAEDETVTTITCTPGSLLAEKDMLSQICDIAAIRIHSMQEEYGALVLSLNDMDALSFLVRMEEDGIFLQTDMLGETPLYFNWEELNNLITEQMDQMAQMGQMQGVEGMPAMDMGTMRALMDDSLTEKEALALMGVDDDLLDYINDVQASQTVETGAFTFGGSDLANQKIVTVLTKEDLARAIDLSVFRNQIESQLMMMDPSLTQDEIDQEIDEELASMKQVIEENDIAVTTTLYQADEEFVAFDLTVTGIPEDSEEGAALEGAAMTLIKKTLGTAEFYQMTMQFFEGEDAILQQYGSLIVDDDFISGKYVLEYADNEPILTANLSCDKAQADDVFGEVSFTLYEDMVSEPTAVLIMFDQQKDEAVTDTGVQLYTGTSVEEIKASLATTDLISFDIHNVVQPDSGFFSALESAASDSSVQLLQMSDDELNAYMEGAEQNFLTTLMLVIENLPPELSNSLMQGMGGY